MFNTIKNLSRKSEKYGDVHFISFLGSILSRLAYLNDNKFLANYNAIMGPVIQPRILKAINSVNPANLNSLLDGTDFFVLEANGTMGYDLRMFEGTNIIKNIYYSERWVLIPLELI